MASRELWYVSQGTVRHPCFAGIWAFLASENFAVVLISRFVILRYTCSLRFSTRVQFGFCTYTFRFLIRIRFSFYTYNFEFLHVFNSAFIRILFRFRGVFLIPFGAVARTQNGTILSCEQSVSRRKRRAKEGGLKEPRVPSSLPWYVRRGWLQGGNRPRLMMIGIRLTAHPTDLSL